MAEGSSKKAVVAAIVGNFVIAITKYFAAALTGSSAMLAEAIHSTVDTGDGLLLFLGLRRSQRPADRQHPFGYGKEVYVWTMVVAMLVFAVGGGMSVYEGITHILHPHPLEDPKWSYIVLGIATVFEGLSWLVSVREFRKSKGRRRVWQTIHETKDPTIFTVVFEDSAALIGIVFAAAGVYFSHGLQMPALDGVASILIGTLLMGVSILLARETSGLIVGEAASPQTITDIKEIARADPSVRNVGRAFTTHFGPKNVVLGLEIVFRPEFSAAEAADAISRLERAIRDKHPEITNVFVEAQSLGSLPPNRPAGAPNPPREQTLH